MFVRKIKTIEKEINPNYLISHGNTMHISFKITDMSLISIDDKNDVFINFNYPDRNSYVITNVSNDYVEGVSNGSDFSYFYAKCVSDNISGIDFNITQSMNRVDYNEFIYDIEYDDLPYIIKCPECDSIYKSVFIEYDECPCCRLIIVEYEDIPIEFRNKWVELF